MVLRTGQGKAHAQIQSPGLGDGIGGIGTASAPLSRQRRHMHHLAVALLLHHGKHGLGHEKHALEINVHHAVPAVEGDLLNGAGPGDARHVHQNVDAAENIPGLGNLAPDVGKIRHVELQRRRLTAPSVQIVRHGLGRDGIQVRQDHLCAVVRQNTAAGLADAAPAAGDQRHLIL